MRTGVNLISFTPVNKIKVDFHCCVNLRNSGHSPLSAKNNMHILLTRRLTFLEAHVGRICLNPKTFYRLVIVSFILMSCMFDQVAVIKEKLAARHTELGLEVLIT